MATQLKTALTGPTQSDSLAKLCQQYGCGPVQFSGTDEALYERHLLFDDVVSPAAAGPRERIEALARSVRDVLSQRWVLTEETYHRENVEGGKAASAAVTFCCKAASKAALTNSCPTSRTCSSLPPIQLPSGAALIAATIFSASAGLFSSNNFPNCSAVIFGD
jgi:hypothetical protein